MRLSKISLDERARTTRSHTRELISDATQLRAKSKKLVAAAERLCQKVSQSPVVNFATKRPD